MTHNIVVQFSFSVWKPSEAARAAELGFNVGDFKEYRVVAGSVFNEEYNETLDSATIVLSQIPKEDRLSDIKPYDYVRVFDKSSQYNNITHKYAFDVLYLVDNFDEKENNIKEHIFGYTINLMSETKILEKIQCPNLTITHDVKDGVITKKTIYEYISRYMKLYVPKIKYSSNGSSWNYMPLVGVPAMEAVSASHTTTISFTASEFEPAEVPDRYILEKSGPALTFEHISGSVEVTGTSCSGFEFYSDINAEFDEETKSFSVYGEATSTGSGTITITYKYKTLSNFAKRFNTPCADMSFNCPTLRQLLTTLMQQVGCIPVVKNRILSYLDFQKDAVPFGDSNGGSIDYSLGNTVNYIRRSLSSDSYVNTLANISNQVLDSGNEVICETLGFRDSNNVFLKQKENLTLETSLPIYKVNKCVLHGPGKYGGYITSNNNCYNLSSTAAQNLYPTILYKKTKIENGTATVRFSVGLTSMLNTYNVTIENNKIYFLAKDVKGRYLIVSERTFNDFVLTGDNLTRDDDSQSTYSDYYKDFSFSGLDSSVVGFFFYGTISNNVGTNPKSFSFIRFDATDEHIKYIGFSSEFVGNWTEADVAVFELNIAGSRKWDITKLVLENSIRNLLSRDFVAMAAELPKRGNGTGEIPESDITTWTIDKLAKYVYGTVGYSIGSNKISGFSDVFAPGAKTGLGWIVREYTYIENIINFLQYCAVPDIDSEEKDLLFYFFEFLYYIPITFFDSSTIVTTLPHYGDYYSQGLFIDYQFRYYSPITDVSHPYGKFSGQPFFTTFFVDLYYQPLNSFNMSYVKSEEDIAIPLVQYDSNASGVTDFDRLSIHEQEQVNRIGNETLSISQRTSDFSKVKTFANGPLYFKDDTNRNGIIGNEDNGINYIIFKRSFSINNNCYNVSYIGSKDAVLKDYFTSIRTKYRAYQYVDYNQSVLRKEKDVMYIRIARDFYDGDDRIKKGYDECFGNFVYDFGNDANQEGYVRNISYEVETDLGRVDNNSSAETQTIKNSVSLMTTINTLALIYEYMDNIGAGPYITELSEGVQLGGIPQSYQIWDEYYNEKHEVSFTNFIDFYSTLNVNYTSSNISDAPEDIVDKISKIEKSPIVDNFPYQIVFSVVESTKSVFESERNKRTFYKDYAERINHTVQFIYYAPNKDVLFSEDFIAGTPLVNRYLKPFNIIYYEPNNKFELNTEPHSIDLDDGPIAFKTDANPNFYSDFFEVISDSATNIPSKIRVHFPTVTMMKIGYYDEETGLVSDIAAFKNPTPDASNITVDYYFMINDTKTDYVFAEKNGILYKRYKVYTYSDNSSIPSRDVIDLYSTDEED